MRDLERFNKYIEVADNGCWLWTGAISTHGYGFFGYQGKSWLSHRVSFTLHKKGKLVKGMQINHMCHDQDTNCNDGDRCLHRRCCNPAHLEQVSPKQNTLSGRTPAAKNAQKIHCDNGHEYTPDNTGYVSTTGERYCRTCSNNRKRAKRAEVLAEREAKGIIIKMGPALKTHCKRGHPLSGDNLHIGPTGIRYCKICCALSTARYRARKKSQST